MNGRDISSSRVNPSVRSHAGFNRLKWPLKSRKQRRSIEISKKRASIMPIYVRHSDTQTLEGAAGERVRSGVTATERVRAVSNQCCKQAPVYYVGTLVTAATVQSVACQDSLTPTSRRR